MKKEKKKSKKKTVIIIVAAVALLAIHGATMGVIYSPHKETPRGDSPRIVCIGDSITFGHGVAFSRSRDAWPRILERELDGNYEVLNYGIGGATLLANGNQPYNADYWETAKSLEGQIYILMLGTNDSKPNNWDAQEYSRQLDERVKELKAIPSVEKVYVMAPPPAFKSKESNEYAAFKIDPVVIRDEIRDIVKNCTMQNEVEYIDLYGLMDGHPEYMTDGVHPNKKGNEVIAEYISQIIGGNGKS